MQNKAVLIGYNARKFATVPQLNISILKSYPEKMSVASFPSLMPPVEEVLEPLIVYV